MVSRSARAPPAIRLKRFSITKSCLLILCDEASLELYLSESVCSTRGTEGGDVSLHHRPDSGDVLISILSVISASRRLRG